MKSFFLLTLVGALSIPMLHGQVNKTAAPGINVNTSYGQLEGVKEASGIYAFKGIPFAAPPVGELRWKEPQPLKKWDGVRPALAFGARAMQKPIFGDMGFRSDVESEDCLYLNVWTPAKSPKEKLPVLVYFYGGGFMAGDGSESRYDGEQMAKKGIVALTVNYRLGVFGFFTHPELTKESPHNASGNYGLLDQQAALAWVRDNIAAFGGDPKRVTIAGESAGSIAVSALMASPLSKDLIAGAIGESGSIMGTLTPVTLPEAEKVGLQFATGVGANSLAALRAMPASQLLDATVKPGAPRFPIVIDGYFLPKQPVAIFASGEQAKVPLLVGWNSEEMSYRMLLGADIPTPENYRKAVEKAYGQKTEEVLKLYPATTQEEVVQSATDLAGDRFIGFSTWKWSDVQAKTGTKPVYRYYFTRPRPAMNASMGNATPGLAGGVVTNSDAPKPPPARGAVHSAEIEYAMGNLAGNKVYAWTADDHKVSKLMLEYFANFVKTGNPNGKGLPKWPTVGADDAEVMIIDVNTRAEKEKNRSRYLFLEQAAAK
ncbi:MAG: carboxylesterase family protein [Chitinophagaceae bacterium]|nr:MAG: carboxylesterase family protein [Chitinophagaceae bacterium]